MLNSVIYDAVRTVERESRSALPNSPVVAERERGTERRFRARMAISLQLRRLADALEPAPRVATEPSFTVNPRAGC